MQKMQDFYTTDGDAFKIPQKDVQKGLLCAVNFSDIWHRGRILKELSAGFVRVCYIDFGTVEDVKLEKKVRYLTEDFVELPAMARRGVLSHVQPKSGGIWSDESIKFFRERTMKKKIEVKIFKQNARDSSYNMAMKTTEGGKKPLIASVMIDSEFCDYDEEFGGKEIVNANELDFEDYETGKNWEKRKEEMNQPDSWLPKPSVEVAKKQNMSQSSTVPSPESPKAENRSTPFEHELKFQKSPRQKLQFKMDDTISNVASSISLKSTSFIPLSVSRSEASSKMAAKRLSELKARQIVGQSFQNFNTGSTYQVYIHSIDDISHFYFFLEDEFCEIRTFLKKFK